MKTLRKKVSLMLVCFALFVIWCNNFTVLINNKSNNKIMVLFLSITALKWCVLTDELLYSNLSSFVLIPAYSPTFIISTFAIDDIIRVLFSMSRMCGLLRKFIHLQKKIWIGICLQFNLALVCVC